VTPGQHAHRHNHPTNGLEIGYVRMSITKQNLEHQLDARNGAGIPAERIYADKKSGATIHRERLETS
jgi:DNA invertase Pin-like site-specific DNA recombinase